MLVVPTPLPIRTEAGGLAARSFVQDAPHVAMVAGETSGDLLAGLLLDGLKTRWPTMTSGGIGGPQMASRGFHALWPSDKLAVRGYVEVLSHYREIVGIRKQLKSTCLDHLPGSVPISSSGSMHPISTLILRLG